MGVSLYPIGSHQRQLNRVMDFGRLDEIGDAALPVRFVFLSDRIGIRRVLHLAEVDDAVPSLDDEIDLMPGNVKVLIGDAPPGGYLRGNPGDSEDFLHLRHMVEACQFEGKAFRIKA